MGTKGLWSLAATESCSPRVAVSLCTNRSLYAWLLAEKPVSIPTRVTSDIYQVCSTKAHSWAKASDVDAFEKALCIRFPENRIPSHDLLEVYAQSGLLSDVQL
jgi:hypothetical protein